MIGRRRGATYTTGRRQDVFEARRIRCVVGRRRSIETVEHSLAPYGFVGIEFAVRDLRKDPHGLAETAAYCRCFGGEDPLTPAGQTFTR